MSWPLGLLLLSLLNQGSGVHSLATLTQPASQSVSLGGTVTISCSGSSDGSWGPTFPWYQQKPGQSPRFLHCNGCSDRGEGVPDRFSASRSGTIASLTITRSQSEDEADYYCAEWDYTGNMWIFGGGTALTVTGQPSVPPSIHLYAPSGDELQTKKTGTLVCLVDKFYPRRIQVSWTVDGNERSEGVETTRPTKRGDQYMASSYLKLSEDEWGRHDKYDCKVTHDGKNYEKSVRRSECS